MPASSTVAIVRTPSRPAFEQVLAAVRRALELQGGIEELFRPGELVLVNPSWVAPPAEPEAATITHPDVARAVADLVAEQGARPVIAESSAVGVDTEKVIAGSGYRQLREMGYEVVDLKSTKTVKLPVPGGGRVFSEVECFELVGRADAIVSVPKLKTHDQTEVTCSIKKLKGLLSDKNKRAMHQEGLFEGVIDLLAATRPRLAVVDAILCQEGLGPIFGRPVEMNLIVAGRDLVAVDAVCGRIIGYEPDEVLLTVNGAARGLGQMDAKQIEIVGERLETVQRRFLRAAEDAAVEVEGFRLIQGEATCTGCRNTVLSAMIDMRNADQLMYLPGITVVTGGAPVPLDVDPSGVVTIGLCMPPESRSARHVKGCPPNNAVIVQAIIGDRARARRMYADGDLSQTEV